VSFFDFSAEVQRAVTEAPDDMGRWCARTDVGRRLFPGAVERTGFSLLEPQATSRIQTSTTRHGVEVSPNLVSVLTIRRGLAHCRHARHRRAQNGRSEGRKWARLVRRFKTINCCLKATISDPKS
jgi:hypothetical protein